MVVLTKQRAAEIFDTRVATWETAEMLVSNVVAKLGHTEEYSVSQHIKDVIRVANWLINEKE